MAKGLATLVRVNEWTVDEKRRALGVLLRELEKLETARRQLDRELADEQAAAASMPNEAGLLYGVYAEGVIIRRERLDAAIAAKQAEIEKAREALNEAYRELKKYEVIRDNRVREARAAEAREERIQLDEMGIESFRRRS